MTRDNQVKGKQAGNQNEGRQKMERLDRASEAGGGSGEGTYRLGTKNTDPVRGETKSDIDAGNEGGGGAARHSDR